MAQLVNSMPPELTELRAVSTANGGTALTTTLGLISLGAQGWGADYMSITPRNFAGAAVVKYLLNPYLTIFYTKDAGVSVTEISDEMQDGDTTDHVLDSFPITGTGYFYVGAALPFRGVKVDVGTGAQGDNNVVLTAKYWNGGSWVDISDTDGTISGTSSFGQDGSITWSVPAAWTKAALTATGDALPADAPDKFTPMYWTRWEWSAAFDADTDVAGMQALNRSTAYAEYIEGQAVNLKMSDREIGCVEALTDAGTANLLANVGTLVGSEFE